MTSIPHSFSFFVVIFINIHIFVLVVIWVIRHRRSAVCNSSSIRFDDAALSRISL